MALFALQKTTSYYSGFSMKPTCLSRARGDTDGGWWVGGVTEGEW